MVDMASAAHYRRSNTNYPKPIIGIVGGIGAGKSSVANELKNAGCLVIDSDRLAHQALDEPVIRSQLINWFGPQIIGSSGKIDRRKLGAIVFRNPDNLTQLDSVLHPRVEQLRQEMMESVRNKTNVLAVVLDSPLLMESGLHRQCDAIIFVDSTAEHRLKRVMESRGWDAAELARRENFQAALDKKKKIADHIIVNDGEPALMVNQVREVLTTVLARFGRIYKG
jgi:dephospho-CoA kinase